MSFAANAAQASGVGSASATATTILNAQASASGIGSAAAQGSIVVSTTGAAASVGEAIGWTFFFQSTASIITPDADDNDGSWLNEVGGTTLVPSIDEMVPNNSDYIISSVEPISDIARVRLSDPSGAIQQPMSVFYRCGTQGTGSINLKVRLMQGTTQIAEWTHFPCPSAPTTVEQVLTSPQFTSITDPTNLFLEFEAAT